MHTRAAGIICALLGVLAVRVVATGEAATFVSRPITVLLAIAGVVMLALGVWAVVGRGAPHDHEHLHQAGLWSLLAVPLLLVAVVAPRPLGSYTVTHQGGRPTASAAAATTASFAPLTGDPAELTVEDYWKRSTQGGAATLQGRQLALVGFVSGPAQADGSWTLARLRIWCCAADALPFEVTVHGRPAPQDGQWVRVTGTYLPANAATRIPNLTATAVTAIAQPEDPYLR